MPSSSNPRPFSLWLLLVLLVLLSLGALAGGGAFLLAPDGSILGMPMSHLEGSPFADFFIPGLLLFTFLGVYPLVVVYSLWALPSWRWPDRLNPFKQFHWSWAASLAAGLIVIVWILVQIQFIPFGSYHALYLGWGAVLVGLSLLPGVRRYCRREA